MRRSAMAEKRKLVINKGEEFKLSIRNKITVSPKSVPLSR